MRRKLPNRRSRTPISFTLDGHKFHAGGGHYPSGELGEIFLAAGKSGTLLQAICSDAAIAASVALQYGAPIEVLRDAFLRNDQDKPASPLGAAVDLLCQKLGTD